MAAGADGEAAVLVIESEIHYAIGDAVTRTQSQRDDPKTAQGGAT
jgi:hypothetical protein